MNPKTLELSGFQNTGRPMTVSETHLKSPLRSDHTNPPHELIELRERIDDFDNKILETLAARDKIVRQVAEVKKRNGIPIRDKAREATILAERREQCERLDLPSSTIESVYRVLLAASRDKQAQLGTEIPDNLASHTVGIIGGNGGMGQLFAKLFKDAGQDVLIADVDTKMTAQQVTAASDAVLISVPIEKTTEVIRQIGTSCKKDSLIFDITSTKTEPVDEMKKATCCEVIGLHPMFGPNTHTLQEQRVVLVEGRVHADSNWKSWLSTCLTSRGLNLLETTAKEHDRAMGIVQVLTHLSTEVTGLAMARLNVPVNETLEFASPVYLVELLMTARHFGQDPDLYGAIHRANPNRQEIAKALANSLSDWRQAVDSPDNDAFDALFSEAREFFGSFSDRAMKESAHLIDRVVERR
jgi:chorismate mutase/prephenate dehydrogenase